MALDYLLLAQNIKVTNWLTPVWLLSLGIMVGFALVLLMMLKIFIMQRIPGFNSIWGNRSLRPIVCVITGLVYVGLFLGFAYWRSGPSLFGPDLIMPLCFLVPICMLLGFGVWSLISKRMIGESSSLFREGFIGWLNMVCIAFSVFAIVGFILSPNDGFGIIKFVDDSTEFTDSLKRIPATGTFSTDGEVIGRHVTGSIKIEPSPTLTSDGEIFDGVKIPVQFNGQELDWMAFKTNQRLEMAAIPISQVPSAGYIFDIPVQDEPSMYIQRKDGKGMIPPADIDYLYFKNTGRAPAELELRWATAPINKEVGIVPNIAFLVVAVYLMYFVLATLFPKVHAIALATFKTEVGQPLFMLVMIVGAIFIVGSIYVPYNTFGEDIKMYKDSGLTLLRVLAIFLAIWAASKSVAEEIEGRTALTVLSKPVGRRQFILGKFSGISLAIAVMFIVLGLWFMIWTAYKPIYDYQEASKGICEWPECFMEAVHIAPGLFLCFLEVLVFVAISVAISTRFGILANFLICFSVYVLGHLTPLLVQSSLGAFEPVQVFGQLIAIVFPVLNHYDVQAAINTNSAVPVAYLGWSVIYTGLYGSMALLLALVFFEDRDLA